MTKLHYALNFLKMGISIIPLFHRNKKPDTSLIGGTWEQYTTQSNTEYELLSWLGSNWLNYGVIAGWNNLVIIDFDDAMYFDIWKLWAISYPSVLHVIESAFKVITGRGLHVYVRTESQEPNSKRIAKKGGVDIQAQTKFVVGPGSTHPNGTQYVGVGQMIFPVVQDIESILPLDLFPRVAPDPAQPFAGVPVEIHNPHTEYDAFQMAMFGDYVDLISRVKQSVRIESFFSNTRKTSTDGRWLSCLCPFHDDTNPSFWIDVRGQICGCQVCGMRPMDVINLYARMHNVTDSEAVSLLAKDAGVWG